jgi:hypothetical protein
MILTVVSSLFGSHWVEERTLAREWLEERLTRREVEAELVGDVDTIRLVAVPLSGRWRHSTTVAHE